MSDECHDALKYSQIENPRIGINFLNKKIVAFVFCSTYIPISYVISMNKAAVKIQRQIKIEFRHRIFPY